MSITFTDVELRTTSKIILSTPIEIASLNAQKVNVLVGKADALLKDNANIPFYENYKSILEAYYDESVGLNGTTYTKYLDSQLEDAARLKEGNVHYPTSPAWIRMSPKTNDANVGLPTSINPVNELADMPIITTSISQLVSGFNDGPTTSVTTAIYPIAQTYIETLTAGYMVGNRIVVSDGVHSMLAVITGTALLPTPRLLITVTTPPTLALGIGAVIAENFSGFTNAERESGISAYPEIYSGLTALIDANVIPWKTSLESELVALNLNTDIGTQATEIATAKVNVQDAIDIITTWQAAPATGVGVGRFGDTVLTPLENKIASRPAEVSGRIAEITTAIGTLSQDVEGAFTGTGNVFSFFKWIDFRISKSSGTLFSYYNFDLIITFIDDKIVKANSKSSEYALYMVVKKLSLAPDGTNTIKVTDTTGLAISDTVKIMDDTLLAITTATISGISGQFVTLSVPISGYALDKYARLVKLL